MPPRNRIPLEHRDRIVRVFEDEEEDYALVPSGLNRSTAGSIVARYIRGRILERPRGGRNTLDNKMRDCLEESINES